MTEEYIAEAVARAASAAASAAPPAAFWAPKQLQAMQAAEDEDDADAAAREAAAQQRERERLLEREREREDPESVRRLLTPAVLAQVRETIGDKRIRSVRVVDEHAFTLVDHLMHVVKNYLRASHFVYNEALLALFDAERPGQQFPLFTLDPAHFLVVRPSEEAGAAASYLSAADEARMRTLGTGEAQIADVRALFRERADVRDEIVVPLYAYPRAAWPAAYPELEERRAPAAWPVRGLSFTRPAHMSIDFVRVALYFLLQRLLGSALPEAAVADAAVEVAFRVRGPVIVLLARWSTAHELAQRRPPIIALDLSMQDPCF